MRSGLIAQKLGMTRIFKEDGTHVPVTVLDLQNCQVVGQRTAEKDGYVALQLGAGARRRRHRPRVEHGQVPEDPEAGLRLIEQGLAIARYDSRDGYGRHPREDRYVRADSNPAYIAQQRCRHCERGEAIQMPLDCRVAFGSSQ